MSQDFLIRAIVGVLVLVAVTAPVGCMVVWRRMAYFGDTLAHGSLFGAGLALLAEWQPTTGVLIFAPILALLLTWLQQRRGLSNDTLLAILAYSSLAGGLLLISINQTVNFDLSAYLFGDILTITWQQIALILLLAVAVWVAWCIYWRILLLWVVHAELAAVEGVRCGWLNTLFMLVIALIVALAIKIVGVLLLTALMIIPAAGARYWARGPWSMIAISSGLSFLAGIIGIMLSFWGDLPYGPSIVVAAAGLFFISHIINYRAL